MASVDDLVQSSGYSRSTVFRFLAGKQVRPSAREAILEAAREIGYPLVKPASRDDAAILLSVPPGFEGFRGFAEAVEGVMRRAGEAGVPVIFDEAHAAGRRLGVIILGKGMREEDAERRANAGTGIPCVLVNRIVDDDDASWVSVDFRAAAADAVERLWSAGCRRIACWADAENRRVDLHKIEGLRRAAEARGLSVSILTPADGDLEKIASSLLTTVERPDGWLAPSDEIAMRVIRVAVSLGLRVPEDLSVIGMNDVEGAAYFSPSITSVHVPFRACGSAAVDAVIRLLDQPIERSVKILMSHRLVERESCAPGTDAKKQ
jgi:DNA-binding LacI/PurR family transcriptional regulator